MIFKLWHKLVFTIIGITGVVLILALYISDQSVKKGFLSYINQVESNRLDGLVQNLVAGYQVNTNWEFIRDDRQLWSQYNQRSRSPLPQNNRGPRSDMQILKDIAEKPNPKGEAKKGPKKRAKESNQSKRLPSKAREGNRRPPRRGKRPPRKDIVLLDKDKQVVMGGGLKPKKLTSPVLKEIKTNGILIGYLQFESFTKFTDELDKQFIQYQNHAFLKIALVALSIILLGAALFAAYLRSRINKIGDHAGLLTSGDFSPQTLDKSQDELGQLSRKLDVLGKTLDDNRHARQRWVSDISHELRTPVAVLQGEIEAIQDGIREMSSDSVNSLHHETLRLSRLVTDLHQLSLSDVGALDYVKEPLDLVELVQSVITTHQYQFDSKNITVNFSSTNDVLMVSGDEQRLEQLFVNLANNSQHYTREKGQLEVNIKLNRDKVIVEWSDSEPGVTDEELSQLFDRLYRVEESRNRNAGGSGLGLSICKNIVAAHEGTIEAEHSAIGGITFVVTFPKLTS